MSHFFYSLALAILILPAGVVEGTFESFLVAARSLPYRVLPGSMGALSRAVPLAAVAVGTDHHLAAASGAEKKAVAVLVLNRRHRRLERAGDPGDTHRWVERLNRRNTPGDPCFRKDGGLPLFV